MESFFFFLVPSVGLKIMCPLIILPLGQVRSLLFSFSLLDQLTY